MRTAIDYLAAHWQAVIIPVAVFIFSLIALFWVKKLAFDSLGRWVKKVNWPAESLLVQPVKAPFSLFCLILSAYLGLSVSSIPPDWKSISGNALWTIFAVALTLGVLKLVRNTISYFEQNFKLPDNVLRMARNVASMFILVIAFLTVLDIWGVPLNALLLLIGIAVLVGALAFRDSIPNIFAGFQIAADREIKVGDYIKLESTEEGYVNEIGWNYTHLQASDGSRVIIPNIQLVRREVINYGRPLKKAKQPFLFNTRTLMAELTGLKARSLQEMVNILKEAPEPVIYYHIHHFLEEHQYLVPGSSNDFALWVNDALGNEALAERLSSINTFEFKSLSALRNRMVNIIEEYISQDSAWRPAMLGREFYFMKSVSAILPTPYKAHDLREFVEALRKVSPSSLYYHVFESRLRSGDGRDDFSLWLEKEMEEPELSLELGRIDPYMCTLEGLRSSLIQIIEKQIK